MNFIEQFKNGIITKSELLAQAAKNPTLQKEVNVMFDGLLGEDELESIAAAGTTYGTTDDDTLQGGAGDDIIYGDGGADEMHGGAGDDNLYGDDGADEMHGGAGDDDMDGGYGDDADDVAYGEAGDDTFVWGTSGDGNDTFHGGVGNDTLEVDLSTLGVDSLQEAVAGGDVTIVYTDADGNEVTVTSDMFNEDGSLSLPDGASGTITGQDGDTMTFDGVEMIAPYGWEPPEGDSDEGDEGTHANITGTDGDDNMYGTDGSDTMDGGAGDDDLDGGYQDNADDLVLGGEGDDTYVWGTSGDGNDEFQGGEGNDTLELDLQTMPGVNSLADALNAAPGISITYTDANGNEVPVTSDMLNEDGSFTLPEGATGGTVTGQDGNTLTYSGVETISIF